MTPFSASQPADQVQYRSVSGLAVLALLLGILSVIALAHPGAWIMPLPAIVCSLWALRRIQRQPDELLGRKAALIGLVLALGFGTWAPSRYYCDRWLLNRQAREFIEQWFQFVFQGELEVAHQATLDYYLRQPEGTLLDEFYQNNPEDLTELQTYFSRGLAQDVVDLGAEGRTRFEKSLGMFFIGSSCQITQRFLVYRGDQEEPVAHAQIRAARDVEQDVVYWTVVGLADADLIDAQTTP
jgi:hypothetical protein